MASNGSFSTTSAEGRCVTFSWSIQSQSIANNTTTISWSLTGGGTSGGYVYGGPFSVVINETTVYYSDSRIQVWKTTNIASGTHTILHDSDGNKSFSAAVSAAIYSYAVNCSGSGSWSLTQIPRQANITSAVDFNDEQNPTITYSNPAGDVVESLQACISFDGSTDDISYRDIPKNGSSYTFNLTEDERTRLRNSIPNSNSRTVRFYVRTIISGVSYWSNMTKTMTIINAAPVFNNLGYHDSNTSITAITGNNAMIVRNKSNLMVTYSAATSKKGASIAQYSFTVNGVTKTNTAAGGNIDFGIINSANDLMVSAKAIDSRGNVSNTVNVTIKCYDYYTPSFVSFNAYRCDADRVATLNGDYITWDYSTNYASVNGVNSTTVTIYGTPSGSGTATSTGATVAVNDDGTYNIYAIVTDRFGSSTKSMVDTVYGPVRVLNISADGSNVAVGKIVDEYDADGVFDCRWKIKTGDPASTMKNLTYKGSDTIGSTDKDTTQNWCAMGNLATVFYTRTDELIDQPSQWGLLLNLTNGPAGNPEVHQVWATQSSGSLLHRGGNSSGWNGTWKTILDDSNCVDYVVAQGTTNGWHYSKWKNGKVELWADVNITFEAGKKITDYLWRSIYTISLDGIGGLQTIINGSCPYQYSGMIPQVCRNSETKSKAEIVIASSREIPSFTDTIPIYIIGTWK